jgi:hypothetical protein
MMVSCKFVGDSNNSNMIVIFRDSDTIPVESRGFDSTFRVPCNLFFILRIQGGFLIGAEAVDSVGMYDIAMADAPV